MKQRIKIKKKRLEDAVKPIIGAPVEIHDVDRFGDCFEFTISTKEVQKLQNKNKAI